MPSSHETDRVILGSVSWLEQHPDWSEQQLADAVGCSKSMVCQWKRRFAEADENSPIILFSRSRAPHHHPPRIADEVKERIQEIRLSPEDEFEADSWSKSHFLLPPEG